MLDTREEKYAAAIRLETDGNNLAARDLFAQAAREGHSAAAYSLAKNLLSREPCIPHGGMMVALGAAQRGNADAAHLCAVIAAQDIQLQGHWNVALDFLVQAAEGGNEAARHELKLLAGED